MEKQQRPSLLTIDTAAVHLSSSAAPAACATTPQTPLSATRKRMNKVMKRLKKPNWNRRSRTASDALSESHVGSFSESGSSFSSSLLESGSCISVEDEKNSKDALTPPKEERTTTEEEPKRDNSEKTAIVSNKQSTVSSSSIATTESCLVVSSKNRSTVAVQSDLDQWFQTAHSLLASKEMQAFVQSSNRVVASAVKTSAGTALTASGLVVKTAFLPVTVPLHVAASTTDLVINVAGGVIQCVVQDTATKQLTQEAEKENKRDKTYHTPAQDLLHNIFNFIPYVVQNTVKAVTPALGMQPKRRRRVANDSASSDPTTHQPTQNQEQEQRDDDFLQRLRLDIYPESPTDAIATETFHTPIGQEENKDCDFDSDDDATARTDSTDNTASLPTNPSGATMADFSKCLLCVDDVNVVPPPNPASDKVLPTVYVDLDSDFSDESVTKDAFAQLIQRGMDVTSSNPAVEFTCAPLVDGGMKSNSTEIQWKPEGKTKKDLKDLSKLSQHAQFEALRSKVLIWSGKYRGPKYHGSDNAVFMARGVVNGSPREFTAMLWDSNRTREYNNYCLGRSDVVVINDDISNGGHCGAKVIKSETKVPFTGLSVFLSAVMHARALGDRPEDGYIIFSRSLTTGRAGCHVGKTTGVDESNKNEIILGINIMRPVPGQPDMTDLISVSQVAANMIPPFLAFRIGMMGVEDFFKNVRN